jgi:hypothetical protein
VEAWQLWAEEFTLDALDAEAYWILPMLYRNLLQAGFDHAERPRLAGIYKQMRLRNAIAQQSLQEVLESLDQKHCEVIPGTFTALVLCGEEAISLDPVELLVPVHSVEPALAVLRSGGWKPLLPLPPPPLLPFVPSVRCRHDSAGDLTLCWRPFGLDCAVENDGSLWRRSVLGGTGTRAIRLADPVDQLLMTVQGGHFLQVCVMLHRTFPAVSGRDLAGRVQELGLAPLWPGLTESPASAMSEGIPARLMQAPSRAVVFCSLPDSRVSLPRLAMRHWRRYRRCHARLRPSSFLAYGLQYYRYAWQSGNLFQIVFTTLKKVWGRLADPAGKVREY